MNSGFYGFPKTNKLPQTASFAISALSASYSPNPKSYAVFTALLTQTGTDDFETISSGSLTKGVSYQVVGTGGGNEDFSNVGLSSFSDGAWFIATDNAYPNNWDGSSLGYNSGAPIAIVVENTIGTIWFSYEGTGTYGINSNNLFIENKTILFNTPSTDPSSPLWLTTKWINSNQLYCTQFDGNGNATNSIPSAASIEVRVYN